MTIDHVEPWVETESGIAFDLLRPRAEDVSLVDVAGHLSKINRYAGATLGPIGPSVAQHSVHVSRILEVWGAPLEVQREGLLHDAPEAYYGDVSSPVQRAMRAVWRAQIDEVGALALGKANELSPAGRDTALAIVEGMRGAILVVDPFSELREIVDPVVRGAFGLPLEESPLVKRADLVALACERHAIMAPCLRDWNLPEFADTRWRQIVPKASDEARREFIARHDLIASAIVAAQRAQQATP